MPYNLRPVNLDTKRNFSLLFLAVSLIFGCARHESVIERNTIIDPVAGTAEQLPTITVEALKERIDSTGAATFVLDVRTPEEYNGPLGHIEGARLIPLQELSQRLDELADVKDRPIFVICRSGGRSAQATRILLDAGFQATNVGGGMQAWYNLVEKQGESAGDPS